MTAGLVAGQADAETMPVPVQVGPSASMPAIEPVVETQAAAAPVVAAETVVAADVVVAALPVLAAVPAETAALTVSPVPEVAEAAAQPIAVPAPAAVAEPVLEAVAAPVQAATPVSDPIIVPPAPKAAPVDLSGSLLQAGLVMIETSSSAPRPVAAAEPAPVLGRKPKPAPVIASEPLQMVETKHD